ncbi:MAG: hypothetical protein JW697_05080 [Kosmotogaceae bacterium]|nr:hypothetical protein [Kosmotogaceae bacterium]
MNEEEQINNNQPKTEKDSELKAVIRKYSIIAVIVLSVFLMIFSTRGRVESFNPESVLSTIEEALLLFVNQRLVEGNERVEVLEVVSSDYEEIEWGEYTYEIHTRFSLSEKVESLYSLWKYRVRDDNLDLLEYSSDGENWFEP